MHYTSKGFSPNRRQAIVQTSGGLLSVEDSGTNLNQNRKYFFQEITFENIVCKMTARYEKFSAHNLRLPCIPYSIRNVLLRFVLLQFHKQYRWNRVIYLTIFFNVLSLGNPQGYGQDTESVNRAKIVVEILYVFWRGPKHYECACNQRHLVDMIDTAVAIASFW